MTLTAGSGLRSLTRSVARRSPTIEPDRPATRRVVFQYLVPVHVEVEDGLVVCVTVIDKTPVRDPSLVEGDAGYLPEAVTAADDCQPWPSWRFGY